MKLKEYYQKQPDLTYCERNPPNGVVFKRRRNKQLKLI